MDGPGSDPGPFFYVAVDRPPRPAYLADGKGEGRTRAIYVCFGRAF